MEYTPPIIDKKLSWKDKFLRVPQLKKAAIKIISELGELPVGRIIVFSDSNEGFLGRWTPAARAVELNIAYSANLLDRTQRNVNTHGINPQHWNDVFTLAEELYHAYQWNEDKPLNEDEAKKWAEDFTQRWFESNK